MSVSLLFSVFSLFLGIVYTILAFGLKKAIIGRPQEPKIFPLLLGISLIVLSLVLLFKEIRKRNHKTQSQGRSIELDLNTKKILLTCLYSLVYVFLFARVGYVISTILFLAGMLWIFNGKKKWKINIIVVFAFVFSIYILFVKMLGIYLPLIPRIWI